MKAINYRVMLEVLGAAAVSASLIFVGIELIQSRDAAKAENGISVAALRIEERTIRNEYADIWMRGNAQEEMTETEAFIYRNLVLNYNSVHFWSYGTLKNVGIYSDFIPIQLAKFYVENPGAAKIIESEIDAVNQSVQLANELGLDELMWFDKLQKSREYFESRNQD